MWQALRIAVVIPAFNERALIAATLRSIPPYVDSVFVIDDHSADGTDKAVLAVADPRVTLLRHDSNRGVGAAICTGYHAAADVADALIVMAGDNQMCPEDIPRLLSQLTPGVDYVKGNRFLHPERARMPRLRRAGSRALSSVTRLLTGLDVDDCQCGFTVLSAECAKRLPLQSLWPRYGFPNDLLLMLAAFGAVVREVPIRPVYATEASGLHAGHVAQIVWLQLTRQRLHRRLARSEQVASKRDGIWTLPEPPAVLGAACSAAPRAETP